MDSRHRNIFLPRGLNLSRKSLVIGALFGVTLVAAVCVDVDALLEYFRIIAGAPGSALELGGILTTASAAPLLAMGMSIADDEMHGRT
jgi:hypothetical protein